MSSDAASLSVGCPRCAVPVAGTGRGAWSCPEHGVVDAPLWRPRVPGYASFVEHLRRAGTHPTYLPWPLGPGWSVSDFAVVADRPGHGRATLCAVSGTSQLDGDVDVLVVSEEPGTGLGSRAAGRAGLDPGPEVGEGPPTVHVRVEGVGVGLWSLSATTGATEDAGDAGVWDRSVLVGEAHGRWLWMVLRPASAVLLLRDEWILRDLATAGPQLVELPFGDAAPRW